MLYHVIALLIATVALVKGFRTGFARQIPKFLGFCFGVVCARIFMDPVAEGLRSLLPGTAGSVKAVFIYNTVATGLIFMIVYELFSFITGFLKYVTGALGGGILDSMAGSVFTLVRYVMFLSMAYNFILCWQSDSILLKYAKSDDGNIVEEVMLVSPAILGGEDVEELAHKIQLEEAKCIS